MNDTGRHQTDPAAPTPPQDGPHAPHSSPERPDAGAETPDGAGGRQTGAGGFPDVQGRCPACNGESLMLADGGYITCRRLNCPDPEAAHRAIEERAGANAYDRAINTPPSAAACAALRERLESGDLPRRKTGAQGRGALREQYAAALSGLTVLGGAPPSKLVPALDWGAGKATRIADWQPLDTLLDTLLAVRDREMEQLRQQLAARDAALAACTAQLVHDQAALARVRRVLAERRAEVADREPDGMLPFGAPGASWCDAVAVTCDRIDDALRVFPPAVGIPCEPAHDDGPTVTDCREADRAWPLQKGGE